MVLPYKTFEEWKNYGLEKGFNERNPMSLSRSENPEESSWYVRGSKKNGLNILNLKEFIILFIIIILKNGKNMD